MFRGLVAYLAIVGLLFAGLVLADARGRYYDLGTEIAICTGAVVTTISVGPDGQTQKDTEPCPDGVSIFAASFTLPPLPSPDARLLSVVSGANATTPIAQEELSPSARGPPALA